MSGHLDNQQKRKINPLRLTIAVALVLAAFVLFMLPYWLPPRTTYGKGACVANLWQIKGAKDQWALGHNKKLADTPQAADLADYFKNRQLPVCPAGGTYTIGKVGDSPTCSKGAEGNHHEL